MTVVWLHYGDHTRHPFVRYAVQTLVQAGHQVTVLDRASHALSGQYKHKAIRPVSPRTHAFMQGRVASVLTLASMLWHARGQRPRAVIVTSPEVALVGWLVARLSRGRIIYYPFELFGDQHFRVAGVLRWIERLFLRRAVHAVVTQNSERARIYVEERGSRVLPIIVKNFKPHRAVEPTGRLRAELGVLPETRIVVYEGQLVAGRWLDRLVRAALLIDGPPLLVFMGERTAWWDRVIEPMLRDPAVAARVRVVPSVPEDAVITFAADADAGIIIYDDQVRNNLYCAPGKLSDYVLAGVPVVAPDFPSIGPTIRAYEIGAVFSSGTPEAIAAAIRSVLAVPRERWGAPLDRARHDLIWETQAPALLAAVEGRP